MTGRGAVAAPRKVRPPFANAWFFPAACLYGALAVPAWVATWIRDAPLLPGLATPAGHGHEMLFGYAFAVVAGYLLGPQPLRITLSLLSLWLSARITFLLWPGSWLAIAAMSAFAMGVAAKVVPRFALAAKKWRNRTVAPVVVGFSILAAAVSLSFGSTDGPPLLLISLVLLSVLLYFMGGRIIAPAVAGHLTRRGLEAAARVQPGLEGATLITLLAALALLLVPWQAALQGAGALLMLAGALIFVRLLRWQLWHCRRQMDLLVLGLGYGWLAFGLLLLGFALCTERPITGALHALSVGALGTLTVVVMARTRLLYRYRDANRLPAAHWAAVMMTGSALGRLAPAVPGLAASTVPLLILSAVLWSAALLVLLTVLVRTLPSQVPSFTSNP